MKKEQQYNLPQYKGFRRDLRNGMTPAEISLWLILKDRQVDGLKFRRQFGVGPYILDFYCPALKLAIELDGQVHFSDEARAYDAERDAYLLREHSIRVLRYENRIVFDWPSLILDEIREAARDILSK